MKSFGITTLSKGLVVRHYEGDRGGVQDAISATTSQLIADHVCKYIGPISSVVHETRSEGVHIDAYHVAPTPTRNLTTLITAGMSTKAMNPPPSASQCQFAELVMVLPPDWPINENAFQNINTAWPFERLFAVARLPHDYSSWLWWGHSIPNGDPPRPYAPTTKLAGVILGPALTLPREFYKLRCDIKKKLCFSKGSSPLLALC